MPSFVSVTKQERQRMRGLPFLLFSSITFGALLFRSSAAGGETMSFKLASDVFEEGTLIPKEHTCDGADRSPPIHWEGAPDDTKSFAIVVDDPDAPSGNWNHWLVYNIPPAAKALAEGVPTRGSLGDGTRQGTNDFGKIGYGGPCPPRGSNHRYYFRCYALSALLELEPGAKRDAVLKALKGKTLGEAQLIGRYGR
jgi:Raf kinase inhibitor-like YbhB/YbcL family protein